MKRQIDGKRFSKRERITMTPEEFHEFAVEHGEASERPDGRMQYTIPGGWSLALESARQAGASYLRLQGLPATSRVYRWADRSGWHEDKPPTKSFRGMREIDSHITSLGYDRDSPEDLAARMLTQAERVQACHDSGNVGAALTEAVELGHVMTLARVYNAETPKKRDAGRRGAAIRWADDTRRTIMEIIARLSAKQDATPSDLWPEFWAELDDAGFRSPKEESDHYEHPDLPDGKYTYEAFRKNIARARRDK